MEKNLQSKFASPDRSNQEEVVSSSTMIANQGFLGEALNAFPDVVLVLDKNRQIIYANKILLKLLNITCQDGVLSKRPGEAFNCIHSDKEKAGCGTSEFCRECGVVKAIITAQKGEQSLKECHMTVKREGGDESLDLKVWAVPITIENQPFVVFTIKDIKDEKRRESLERTFFHDILNEVGILVGYSENAKDGIIAEGQNPLEEIFKYSKRVVDSIQAQKDLLAAEEGHLATNKETIKTYEFLENLITFMRESKYAHARSIVLDCNDKEATTESDPTILNRVITNLIKNALEASEEGKTVTVGYEQKSGKHLFSVNNESFMPRNIQLQIFQRSFSTKDQGRGTGTYSVKLFAEQFLKGKVSFESAENKGTTFFVELN